jgi:hypothetical protein
MAPSLRRPAAYALALALLASSVSCSSTSPSQSPPDQHSGVLVPGKFDVYTFATSTSGSITVTLVSLAPPITVEVQLGAFVNGACEIQVADTGFILGTVWTNSVSSNGDYCVVIDDSPTPSPPASVAYTLTVSHPS